MVDIKKAAKIQEAEIRSYLDKMESEMVEALKHGNIYEVFAKSKFKIAEFQDFFSEQWKSFKGTVIQDEDIKAMFSTQPSPDINMFQVHQKSMSMSKEEQQMFGEGMKGFMSSAGKFKAAKVKGLPEPEGEGEAEAVPTLGDIQDLARETLDEWDQFMGDVWMQILDAQMMSDYTQKMAAAKEEIERLISLAKRGLGVEFVLIALARVNSLKNGCLISWLGKKAFHVNDSINRVADDLHKMNPADPKYGAEMQMASSKTRDGSFQLNLVTQDMQKAMQDVASVLENVHSMIGELNRTRREIVSKFSGR